jgi:predicted Kef-type K+ transport protein
MALALLGVMLLFWAVLLGAQVRELRSWRARSLPVATATTPAPDGRASALDLSGGAWSLERALRTFGWAQVVAGLGVAVSALNLVSRRGGRWLTVTVLALGCLVTSSHLFSVARAQLAASALNEP